MKSDFLIHLPTSETAPKCSRRGKEADLNVSKALEIRLLTSAATSVRKLVVSHWVLAILQILLLTPCAFAAARPNVLFIAIDDLRTDLGCYGNQVIKTPQLDGFAKTAVRFDRAYCQFAVCNPSRASLMAGLRPDSVKVWDLRVHFRDTVPNVVTLPQAFRAAGYQAYAYGKIYHNPLPDEKSWDEPNHWPEKAVLWSDESRRRLAEYRQKMKADGKSQAAINRMRASATERQTVPDSKTPDGMIAADAIAKLRKIAKTDKPFFLGVGFIRPHLPFVVPEKYWNLYPPEKIELAPNPFLPKDSPPMAMNTMYELRDYFDFAETLPPDKGALTEEQQRRLKHGYYASVSYVDAQVGKVLAELDHLGFRDNTIVVVWSDHGWKLGEHRSWGKMSNHELDTRVPFFIRSPGAQGNGQASHALVELLDIYPTLCDLANVTKPAHLQGQSLVPLLAQPNLTGRRAAFSQYRRVHQGRDYMGYAMRTGQYRFVEWIDRQTTKIVSRELYDHSNDSDENTNIAGQIGSTSLIKYLSAQQQEVVPRPAPPASPAGRPQLTIRNQSQQTLAVYWQPDEGSKRMVATLAVGQEHVFNTTLGHRFLIEGTKTDFKTTVTVNRQVQTFSVRAGAPKKRALKAKPDRPNIVFLMADDWSTPHAGALGDKVVKTPVFDRLAREGVLFPNAFVSTPSCTPSRLSILTGQHHWRLREGGSLGGSLREDYEVYTELLQKAGYQIGRYGKGVWPSKLSFRNRDSFGPRFKSFDEFITQREVGKPFCFWYGGQDPHRPYELGVGRKSGIPLNQIKVPACLPDNETVKSDLADYYWEVQRFDRECGEVIARLEKLGELENTLIVMSGDNGMPFPRSKATLYDLGTRVPLAIRWGSAVPGGRTMKDFVTLCDMAPTFLEAAGLPVGKDMTGRSLLPVLRSDKSGLVDPLRTFALTGMEQHVYPYPSRAIRTADFLYIRNFKPDEWPTGEVEGVNPHHDFAATPWPTGPGAFSFNIDPSPSKQFLREHRNDDRVKDIARLSFGRHPTEELYDLCKDPEQLRNVAREPAYRKTREQLRRQLDSGLAKSGDPRLNVEGYATLDIEGWTVRVSDKLLETHRADTERALDLLRAQCRKVVDVLPPSALSKVRTVPIWFSPQYEGFRETGEYHPDVGWLRANRRLGELAGCVEFSNIPSFAEEVVRMPMLLLHELVHAYHHQTLGYDQPDIEAAYEAVVKGKSYEKVPRKGRESQKAYAIVNLKEYFAETSEAFFGENDFYPFNRAELEKHDPRMAKVLRKVWYQFDPATGQNKSNTSDYKVTSPPAALKLDPFYAKYVSANGYPIVASRQVNDYALKEAAYLVDLMLAQRPDVRLAMIRSGSRLIVMGHNEFTTDIPEYSRFKPKDYWDARARGLGGSRTDPVCSCAEENVLAYPGDPYSTENIVIHEFAHNIHWRGMVNVDDTFNDRLKQTYDTAIKKGLWAGKYASVNHSEYFAEGVQSWFDNNRQPDHDHNHVDTRKELKEYDTGLAALCNEVFGDTKLVYTKPQTRLHGHLTGYNPETAPSFEWPARLKAVKEEIREKARKRSADSESQKKPYDK